ncbi:DNA replication licensing factor MCM6 [Enteropsectra breve]|nr:DNA replication licensing factor MCM6 [Enteropsectra breve]
MNLEDAFTYYLESREHVAATVQNILDTNGETLFMDLNELSEQDETLGHAIQKGFIDKYEELVKIFKNYTKLKFSKELDLSFYNPVINLKIRELKSGTLGNLVSFVGTATRSSQVRPELHTGAFICRDCGEKIKNIRQEFRYTEPLFCPNPMCTNRSKYDLDLPECKFSNWQRVHVQEAAEEIPPGSLPRSIDVILRNELIEKIKPGAHIKFTGFCAVVPSGLNMSSIKSAPTMEGVPSEKAKRNTKDLTYKLCFFCIHFAPVGSTHINTNINHINTNININNNNLINNLNINNNDNNDNNEQLYTQEEMDIIRRMQGVPNLYENLSDSLFPTIYGHANIKSAILLMLVGGTTRKSDIKQRGTINVLLVGDPGTAKSQFLKQTASISPNSVYTSGKSSTAAGLTVAVVKDSETGDFAIEAGALLLADGGVCCIDEFDKMNYKDQVSIHEAMEQQTITIAKAGINATLNSRASILAAANPVRGRYDKRKTLRQNVNLSAPIMSRFDLYFVLIDEIDKENDKKIAGKILSNHVLYNNNSFDNNFNNNYDCDVINTEIDNDSKNNRLMLKNMAAKAFTVEEVMLYIKYVKNRVCELSDAGKDLLVEKYLGLRQDSLANTNNYRLTARHLESMLRLSEALAKLHNDRVISAEYVQEACRLLKSSVIEVTGEEINLVCKENEEDFVVSNKDYVKITNNLIYLVKMGTYSREELAMKYLESVEDRLTGSEMVENEHLRCLKVIDYLVDHESILFEMDGCLYVHPNYDR